MRDLINIIKLFEADTSAIDELKGLLAKQIKQLPDDDKTARALQEIEDLLQHVGSGGRMGIINANLDAINDPTVNAARKDIARFILGIDMTPAQRTELFTLWKNDKLINISKLLEVGQKTFSDIVTSYDSNPAIAELTNELMRIAALGQGKGEFGLSVMSKSISKPTKGDLLVQPGNRKIEVKTTDGGAGRFTDQEVRPAEGFEQAARDLNAFVKAQGGTFPASGLAITTVAEYAGTMAGDSSPETQKTLKEFLTLVEKLITILMGGSKANRASIKEIMDDIRAGDPRAVLQSYARANFDYYMSMKDDEGVLYIDLNKDPIKFIFFKDSKDLAAAGLRFHSSTVYLTSVKDARLMYPQIEIVPTSFGGDQAERVQGYMDKQAAKAEKEAAVAAKINSRASIEPNAAKKAAINRVTGNSDGSNIGRATR